MTREDHIAHWKKGAEDAIEAAEVLLREEKYSLALFHCHLGVEKLLKSKFLEEKQSAPPHTHDLLSLALELNLDWSEEEQRQLSDLTTFAIAARYDDLGWEDAESNVKVEQWLDISKNIFSHFA
jgi:HEPN domain-containing protein